MKIAGYVIGAAACLCVTVSAIGAQAPQATARKPITDADYSKWESLGNGTLSPDGKWLAYTITRAGGGSELRYRTVAEDSVRIVRGGSGATFTENGRWLIYTVNPAAEAGGAAGGRGDAGGRGGRGAAAPAQAPAATAQRNRIVINDLRAGTSTTLPDIQAFNVSSDEEFIALRRYPPTGRLSRGAELVVRKLDRGAELTLGSVADYSWSPNGATLAMTIDVEGRTGNGVQLFNAATGVIRSLDASDSRYSNLLWRPKSDDLAVFRTRNDTTFADTSMAVIAWRGALAPDVRPTVYDFATDRSFPAGMRVVPYRAFTWREDGGAIFFGIAARIPKPQQAGRSGNSASVSASASASGAVQPANVQVWHWKDVRQNPAQALQAAADRTRNSLAVWHIASNKFARIADDSLDTILLSPNQKVALASDDAPYEREAMFGRPWRDVFRIDLNDGSREKIITRISGAPRLSPEGRYALYTSGGHWWALDLATKAKTNLTAKIKSAFMNMEDDHPVAERQPYGLAGFTTGERGVVLYDRFDLWHVSIDGSSPARLTSGREDSTIFRRISLDPEERTIDLSRPVLLSASGEWSKKSGYARLTTGKTVERLVWLDRSVTALEKATKADVFLYQTQTYEESPNFFVAGPGLTNAKQMTRTNAFQNEYSWGRQELFTYTTKAGLKLQAMLTYPAGYEAGKKYPMVVYFYEKLSQGFHQYVAPSATSLYNTQVFSQAGYFVLRPDITFRPRDPGVSALECVTAAVQTAIARAGGGGAVDPKKVGSMGHSWGGYQSAFFAAHGKAIFAAAIAGAPLTDLVSFYGYTSGNSGAAETGHFEVGQERMQVPLWEDPQAYIRNSTVFAVDKMEVPLLLEEGADDGNVNPFQSQELYNFARRLGKNVVYLVYPGENHNLAQRNNQIDYRTRQLEWFDHYLKGNPAAKWITDGESYQERQKLLQSGRGGGPGGQ